MIVLQKNLNITYPSTDLLKTIEAVQRGQSRPVVIIGARGLGKSHLMAAISQMLRDPEVDNPGAKNGLHHSKRRSKKISFRSEMEVIAESMEMQNYKFLWDLLFDIIQMAHTSEANGMPRATKRQKCPDTTSSWSWFRKPTVLILDEFQTWYEGLTNPNSILGAHGPLTLFKFYPRSQKPILIFSLVISVRDGFSDAAQQVYRVNPVRIDFKGPQAKKDRQRLLLYRIFENRLNIADADIEALIKVHFDEYLRLYHIPGSEHDNTKLTF